MPKRLAGKRILVVNTGSPNKRFILKQLKKLEVEVICLNDRVNWAKGLVDDWIIADTKAPARCLAAVYDYLAGAAFEQFDGVVTFWEDDVILAARLAEELGLPGVGVSAASIARDKSRFRACLEEFNIASPRSMVLRDESDCEAVVSTFSFPLVLKPVFGASSAYVTRVDNRSELLEAFRYLKTSLSPAVESALHDGLEIMAEEYIKGDEVDVDIILQNGKVKFWSISDNDGTEEPFFVETGEAIPSQLSEKVQHELLAVAEEVLERMGVQFGCIHFEAKATAQGVVPIEANLRMGGDEVYSFVKCAWGYDLIEAACCVACSIHLKPFQKPEGPLQYLRGRYVLPPRSGILTKVEVPKEKLKEFQIREFAFPKSIGDVVHVPPEGYEHLGWMIASGSSPHEAEDNLTRAFKMLQFEVAPFRATSSIGRTNRRSPFSSARISSRQTTASPGFFSPSKFTRDDMRGLKVGIACNRYSSADMLVEAELCNVGENIQQTLAEKGYEVRFLDFNNPIQVMSELQREPVDIVFNVCERVNDSSLLEPHAASILDVLQVPYTGSNPFTLALCIDKIRVKKLLAFHRISTPRWDYCYSFDDDLDHTLKFPRIIKPANSDNSIGITNDSVVTNESQFKRQLEYVLGELKKPALIEEFIEGTEYDVSILGNDNDTLQVLPLSRSVFDGLPEGSWSIYPFDSKFGDASSSRGGIRVERPPKGVSKKQLSLVTELALDTYNVLGCSDYGRVEIRVDRDGNPYVLELNPNPSINRGDCLPAVAELVGMQYVDFLEEILFCAIRRFRDQPPYAYLQAPLL